MEHLKGTNILMSLRTKKYQAYCELWPNKAELAALMIAKIYNLKKAAT